MTSFSHFFAVAVRLFAAPAVVVVGPASGGSHGLTLLATMPSVHLRRIHPRPPLARSEEMSNPLASWAQLGVVTVIERGSQLSMCRSLNNSRGWTY